MTKCYKSDCWTSLQMRNFCDNIPKLNMKKVKEIESNIRGWTIIWTKDKPMWVYKDNQEPLNTEEEHRPCKRCNRLPTKEGYDACMGHVEGARSVCCGHGVVKPILIMDNEPILLW